MVMRLFPSLALVIAWASVAVSQEKTPCDKSWTFPVPFFQSIDWSPDGRKLAFSAVMNSWDASYQVYVIGADGSGLTMLSSGDHRDIYPNWSPDGSKLAFASKRDGNSQIYTMKADGSEVVRLSRNAANDSYPDWSPDGSRLVFSSNRDGNEEIYVMNSDGSGQKRLTDHPADDYNPAWSPDGARIVYEADRSGDGADELYLVAPDGTGHDSLGVAGVFPTWFAEGQILFTTKEGIHRLDLRTRNVTLLVENVIYGVASPTGSRLALALFAFDSECKDQHALVVTKPDGTAPLRLLPKAAAGDH